MPAAVKRETKIFATYHDFIYREDRKLNGVSQEFADKYPNYEQQNETNIGCYNCIGCTKCRTCVNCEFCDECRCSCVDCVRCFDCKSCKNCSDAKSCSRCNDCERIKNCQHCKKLKKCSNLIKRKSLANVHAEGSAELWEKRYPEKVRRNMITLPHVRKNDEQKSDKELYRKEIKLLLSERRKNKNRNRDFSVNMLYPILRKCKYPNFTEQQMKDLGADIFSLINTAFSEGASVGIDNFGTFNIIHKKVHSKTFDCPALKQYVRFKMYWSQNKAINDKYFIERKKYESGLLVDKVNEFEIKDPLQF